MKQVNIYSLIELTEVTALGISVINKENGMMKAEADRADSEGGRAVKGGCITYYPDSLNKVII